LSIAGPAISWPGRKTFAASLALFPAGISTGNTSKSATSGTDPAQKGSIVPGMIARLGNGMGSLLASTLFLVSLATRWQPFRK